MVGEGGMTVVSGAKIGLLWWGCYLNPENTVGDYLAVQAMASELAGQGLDFHILYETEEARAAYTIAGFAEREVVLADVDPEQYEIIAWICGPVFPHAPGFRKRLEKFKRASFVAVGVSIPAGAQSDARKVFTRILARDGMPTQHGDLALAAPMPKADPVPKSGPYRIASCLRHHQSFEVSRCGDDIVDAVLGHMKGSVEADWVEIDTRFSPDQTSAEAIESQFADVDLVITTRLHGCLLSLRHRTPFIAIDQIFGGYKIATMMSGLSWPYTIRIEDLSYQQLHYHVLQLSSLRDSAGKEDIEAYAQLAEQKAKLTAKAAANWISSMSG